MVSSYTEFICCIINLGHGKQPLSVVLAFMVFWLAVSARTSTTFLRGLTGTSGLPLLKFVNLQLNKRGTQEAALVGGACYNGLLVGAFASSLSDVPSAANWLFGASLSCKPL